MFKVLFAVGCELDNLTSPKTSEVLSSRICEKIHEDHFQVMCSMSTSSDPRPAMLAMAHITTAPSLV